MARIDSSPLEQRDSAGMVDARGKPAASKAPAVAWKLPDIRQDFSLDNAMATAMTNATRYMNHALEPEGLVIQLPQADAESGGGMRVQVAEQQTARVLREYDAPAFLQLYALRERTNGVVVDGQV